MIAGLGTDIIDVERVAEKIGKNGGFREMVFSKNEIDYCEKKAHPAEHYAARFAAKEALFKALGTGWLNGTAFNEIEIIHDEKGRPSFFFYGDTAHTIAAFNFKNITVSISHVKAFATATVIVEK